MTVPTTPGRGSHEILALRGVLGEAAPPCEGPVTPPAELEVAGSSGGDAGLLLGPAIIDAASIANVSLQRGFDGNTFEVVIHLSEAGTNALDLHARDHVGGRLAVMATGQLVPPGSAPPTTRCPNGDASSLEQPRQHLVDDDGNTTADPFAQNPIPTPC